MDHWVVAGIAGFAFVFSLVSQRFERWWITGPMVFVAFGLILGPAGTDVFDVAVDDFGVELLAEFTLGILLFSDAVRIDVKRLRREFELPARMLALGLPGAILLGTITAMLVLDLELGLAGLVAAILAPTDAALGQTVVTSPKVPVRVRQSLNVESGLNDGLALPAVTIFVALALEEEMGGGAAEWLRFAAEQIGYGALVGVAVGSIGGLAVARASERDWMEGTARQVGVLGLAMVAFMVADEVGGNGFISAFMAGLSFGAFARSACRHIEEFTEDTAHLLAMVSFIVFAAILLGPGLEDVTWTMAGYCALSLLVVRPLAIAVSLIGSGLKLPTVAFFGWFGPRGLASMLFVLLAVDDAEGLDLDPVIAVVSLTVVVSVVAHGVSARPAADAYGRWWDRQQQLGEEAMDDMAEAMPMEEQRVRRQRWRAFRSDSS